MIDFLTRLLGAVVLGVIVWDIYTQLEDIDSSGRTLTRRYLELTRRVSSLEYAHPAEEDTPGINPVMP